MSRLLLNAIGVHSGGGLVLLRELARASRGRFDIAVVDARLNAADLDLFSGSNIRRVPPRLTSRITVSLQLAREANAGDVLFSFNSLPPLVHTAARSIVYVHTSYYAGLDTGLKDKLGMTARSLFGKSWFSIARANADIFWVQTETMQRALLKQECGTPVRVIPFVPVEMRDQLAARCTDRLIPHRAECRYIYPADAVVHKNHIKLLQAWRILAIEGLSPSLELTLTQDEYAAVLNGRSVGDSVVNLGRIPHTEILAKLNEGRSLIFPSLTESLGLPLLEATAAGADIVVAEREYARDVCVAAESFDPTSARSIADAVRRHMGVPRQPPLPFDAEHIVAELLA